MTEPIGANGLADIETALQREADTVAAHYPDSPRSEIDRKIHDTYASLERDATVKAHLVAITGATVADELHESGSEFHPINP